MFTIIICLFRCENGLRYSGANRTSANACKWKMKSQTSTRFRDYDFVKHKLAKKKRNQMGFNVRTQDFIVFYAIAEIALLSKYKRIDSFPFRLFTILSVNYYIIECVHILIHKIHGRTAFKTVIIRRHHTQSHTVLENTLTLLWAIVLN